MHFKTRRSGCNLLSAVDILDLTVAHDYKFTNKSLH